METLIHTRRTFNISEANSFPDFAATPDCKNAFPRFFHPIYTKERISIPTVHVIGQGENAEVKRLAEAAKELCEREKVVTVVHRGGHEIPNNKEGILDVVRAIEKVDFMSQRSW